MISSRISPVLKMSSSVCIPPQLVEIAAKWTRLTLRPRRMSTAIPETPVILYQYRICPFSNIAKTVLTYQQIPFQSIEVNPLTKAELKFSSDYRKVPIVTSPQSQEQWNGTEEILKRFSGSEDSSFGNSQSSMRWQDFARDKLAPLLYPNLCNTLSSSFRAFEYVHSTPSFSMAQKYSIQYIGSLAMYFAAGKIKKKYGLDDVRVALDEALVELESGLKESAASSSLSKTRFLNHSESPHLGDLAVFGVLKGLEGLPILEDILQDDRYPTIRDWFSAMNSQIESKRMVR